MGRRASANASPLKIKPAQLNIMHHAALCDGSHANDLGVAGFRIVVEGDYGFVLLTSFGCGGLAHSARNTCSKIVFGCLTSVPDRDLCSGG